MSEIALPPLSDQDLRIAAETVWGEARGETDIGMRAVACTMFNRRARSSWWSKSHRPDVPDHSLAAVCLCPWQYSCRNEADPNAAKLAALTLEDPQFREATAAVLQAAELAGTERDPVRGATHYYAFQQMPWPHGWGDPAKWRETATLFRHRFYLEI